MPARNADGFFKTPFGGGVIVALSLRASQIQIHAGIFRVQFGGALQQFNALLKILTLPGCFGSPEHLGQRILGRENLSVHKSKNSWSNDRLKQSLSKSNPAAYET
jgi:hypothetical protein